MFYYYFNGKNKKRNRYKELVIFRRLEIGKNLNNDDRIIKELKLKLVKKKKIWQLLKKITTLFKNKIKIFLRLRILFGPKLKYLKMND